MKQSLRLALSALLLGCVAMLSACGPANATDGEGDPAAGTARSPQSGGLVGLEMRWWIIENESDDLTAVLSRHADLSGFLSERDREQLRRSGFRLARVPAERFSSLVQDLTISKEISSDWLGQTHHWISIMRGPWLDDGEQMRIGDAEPRRLPSGRFVLRGRTWTVPTGHQPYQQLELIPRFEQRNRPVHLATPRNPPAVLEFAQASQRLSLQGGYLYLLTAESPDLPWEVGAELSGETAIDEMGDVSDAEASDIEQTELPILGPERPVVPSVAELILRPPTAAWLPGKGRRAMVVLIPHLPRGLSILPPLPESASASLR